MASWSFVTFVAALIVLIASSCCALKFEPFGFIVKKQLPNKILEITKILEVTDGGLITSRNEEIVASIEDLRLNPFVEKRDRILVDGLWESLWTTEKVLQAARPSTVTSCRLYPPHLHSNHFTGNPLL